MKHFILIYAFGCFLTTMFARLMKGECNLIKNTFSSKTDNSFAYAFYHESGHISYLQVYANWGKEGATEFQYNQTIK